MKKLLLLLSVITFDLAIAQSNQADSLFSRVMESYSDPRLSLDSVHQYITSIIKIDPTTAEAIAFLMLDGSREHAYSRGEANANYNIGQSNVYGDFPKAIKYLNEASELYESLGDLKGSTNALLGKSVAYIGLDKKEQALAALLDAKDIADKMGDLKIRSRTYTNLCAMYHRFDQIDSALYYGKIALELKRELGDPYGLRLMLLNLGVIMANFDSLLDNGLQLLLEARSISKDELMINDISSNLAYAYARKKNYPLAIQYLDSTFLAYDSVDNDYTKQGTHVTAWQMYQEMGDHEQALKHMQEDYKLDQKLRGLEVEQQFEVLELENKNAQNQKQIAELEKQKAETNLRYTIAAALFIVVLLAAIVIFVVMRYRVRSGLLIQKELGLKIEHKNRELTSYTVNFVQKNELITSIKDQIKDIQKFARPETNRELVKIHKVIDDSFRVDKEWENFKARFEEVHQGFFKNLAEKYPNLGSSEIRLCALIRLNMNLKESSQILGISPDSVKTARYRIRKKLGLSTEDNIVHFMAALG